jgi:hypothetical protein
MQRSAALKYRIAEFPFVLYNIPELDDAAKQVFTLKNLLKEFGNTLRNVEQSSSNHFMYYKMRGDKIATADFPDWSPPQKELTMTFAEYLTECEAAENMQDVVVGNQSLYYMTMSAAEVLKNS